MRTALHTIAHAATISAIDDGSGTSMLAIVPTLVLAVDVAPGSDRQAQDSIRRARRLGRPVDSPSNMAESRGSRRNGAPHCLLLVNHSKHWPSSSERSGVFKPVIDGQKNSAGGSKFTAQIETSAPTLTSRS